MVRDDLLEQIRQPLLDRVDRRLAVVLAISISAHLAIAILAWVSDPPAERPWLTDDPQVVFTEDMLDQLEVPTPVEPPGPGTAAVAATPKPAAPAVKPHGHRPGTPRAINPNAVMGELLRDDGAVFSERRRIGKGLDEQIEEASRREHRVGKPGDEVRPGIVEGDGPDVDGIDGPTGPGKLPEVAPPRAEPTDPPDGIEYDPTDDIRGRRMQALQRCYQQELLLEPGLHGRVELELTLGVNGKVTAAHATGMGEVGRCVQRLARAWSFPVTLPRTATFGMALIFAQH